VDLVIIIKHRKTPLILIVAAFFLFLCAVKGEGF